MGVISRNAQSSAGLDISGWVRVSGLCGVVAGPEAAVLVGVIYYVNSDDWNCIVAMLGVSSAKTSVFGTLPKVQRPAPIFYHRRR